MPDQPKPKAKPASAPADATTPATTPTAPKTPSPAKVKEKSPWVQAQLQHFGLQSGEFLQSLADKPIQVTSLDGKQYTAVLVGVDQFNILMRLSNGMVVLMPKHAIKLLNAAPPATSG